MTSIVVLGAQWGDEGKGKIVDALAEKAHLIVRYQGGNNAGHTVIVNGQKTILQLIPSGVLHPHAKSVIAHGVVVDPEALVSEMGRIREQGVSVTANNFAISNSCIVVTKYNRMLDSLREKSLEGSTNKIGTTCKGIGPTYEDKVSRRGIKIQDLFNLEILKEKLAFNLVEKSALFENLYQIEYPTVEEEAQRLFELGKEIKEFCTDTFSLIDKAMQNNEKIIYEGAQGALLDIDYGTYPFVTSSNTSVAGVYSGASTAGKHLDHIVGIVKAYTTRVGSGPFTTEALDTYGEYLGVKGHEFGAVTGRKRRCGWLDLPLLKYAVKMSNLTSIIITKADILSGMDTLKVCTKYEYNGEIVDCAYPGIDLYQAKPLYKELTPFNVEEKLTQKNISQELKDYISIIEKYLEIPVAAIAYGPDRDEILYLKKFF